MIRFKNSRGSTLIEAMIAITIVGMTITPMLILATNVLTSVSTLTERFHRLFFAKNFLFKAELLEPMQSVNYSTEKKEEQPSTIVRYTLRSIPEQSSLYAIQRLYKQEVQAMGMTKDAPSATMVQFVYKPKEEA